MIAAGEESVDACTTPAGVPAQSDRSGAQAWGVGGQGRYGVGDQRVRSNTGYKGGDGVNRFNILDVQRQIRFMNKVVIAVVPGWAVGGGHSLHVVCDLTLASKEYAIFKQTDVDVASIDGGFGSAYLARQVGMRNFIKGETYAALWMGIPGSALHGVSR